MTTNSEGIRAPRSIGPKPGNTLRIICIGDSVTLGVDVDDKYAYPSQLEQILNSYLQGRARVEVIDAGVAGYSSRQSLVYLREKLLQYNPDIVIAGISPINDSGTMGLFFPPERRLFKGDIDQGFHKVYRSPQALFAILFQSQPLVGFIKLNYLKYFAFVNLQIMAEEMSKVDKKNISTPVNISKRLKNFERARVPPADFIDNYSQMIRLSRERERERERERFKLIFYIPYVVPPIYKTLILDLAAKYRVPVVDFSTVRDVNRLDDLVKNPVYSQLLQFYRKQLGDDYLRKNPIYLVTTDAMHPNMLGNRMVAEQMARAIIYTSL